MSEQLREKIAKLLWDHIGNGDYVAGKIIDLLREEGVDLEGWRPIESAPEVGNFIAHFEQFGVCEASHYENGEWIASSFNGQILKRTPTHWRPLPKGPAHE